MRIAIAGKGGMGKSLIAGTAARVAARRGDRVLVLDADVLPGLSVSLGYREPPAPALLDAVAQDASGRWGWRDGFDASVAARRCARDAPDGVRVLSRGKVGGDGTRPSPGAGKALFETARGIARSAQWREWTLIADLPAGARETAEGWAPFADLHLVVVTPSAVALAIGLRVARLAREKHPGCDVAFVANQVREDRELTSIRLRLGEPPRFVIPWDPAVAAAEREGAPVIEAAPGGPAVAAIGRMVEALSRPVPPAAAPR
jgi:CO dehydrogenase maturation factor